MMSSSVFPAGNSPFLGKCLNRTEAGAVIEGQNCSRTNCVYAYRCGADTHGEGIMDTHVLLNKREVKMARYWPSSYLSYHSNKNKVNIQPP